MARPDRRPRVDLLLLALRIEPVHDVEHAATVRDLEHIVADSCQSGTRITADVYAHLTTPTAHKP